MSRPALLLLAPLVALLVGCDQLGIESASVVAARQEADGKAVGAACRHAGRAIEDCFALNRRVDKAAIYAGWREMDDYMRENKMGTVSPVLAGDSAKRADTDATSADDAGAKSARADSPDTDPNAKADAKPGAKVDAKSAAKAEHGAKTDKVGKADKVAQPDDADKPARVAAQEGSGEADAGKPQH